MRRRLIVFTACVGLLLDAPTGLAADRAAYVSANAALLDELAVARRTGVGPADNDRVLLTAEASAKSFATTFDTPDFPADTSTHTLCGPFYLVVEAFMEVGAGPQLDAATSDGARNLVLARARDRNFPRYIGHTYPFMLAFVQCNLAHLAPMEALFSAASANDLTDQQRLSAKLMSDGIFHIVLGALQAASIPSDVRSAAADTAYRRDLISVLRRYEIVLSASVPMAKKQILIAAIAKASPQWQAPLRTDAAKLVIALRATTCASLCSL